jgi:hypothetical protein
MGGDFIPADSSNELEVWFHSRTYDLHDFFWDSCREEERLPIDLGRAGKNPHHFLYFNEETIV